MPGLARCSAGSGAGRAVCDPVTGSPSWASLRLRPCRSNDGEGCRAHMTTTRPDAAEPSGFSGWVGVVCGLALGLAVAGIVYIKDHRADTPVARAAKADRKRSHGNEPLDTETADSGAEEPTKSYDFYDMLPKFEVVVPEKDKDVRPDTKSVPKLAAVPMYCEPVRTRTLRMPIASGRGSHSRGSSPRSECRWTMIPGTASVSVRSRNWTSSIGCVRSCARRMWMCW